MPDPQWLWELPQQKVWEEQKLAVGKVEAPTAVASEAAGSTTVVLFAVALAAVAQLLLMPLKLHSKLKTLIDIKMIHSQARIQNESAE